MISIPGNSFEPRVWRYSDCETVGMARVAQYSANGENMTELEVKNETTKYDVKIKFI
jgi:hypothetical protein